MVGISNYVLYVMTGKVPFDLDKLMSGDSSSLFSGAGKIIPGKKETVFKWVDDQGVTHFTEEVPDESLQSEKMELDPNVNIIQSVKIEKEKETKKEPSAPSGISYNPKDVKKLMDDAKNVEKLLQDRHDQQSEMLDSL